MNSSQGSRDLGSILGGALVAGVGLAFTLTALTYPAASGPTVGPGVFPSVAGIAAIGLGLATMAIGVLRGRPVSRIDPRPALAVFGALAVFAVLIQRVGLMPTIFCVVIVSALGSPRSRPWPVLVLALFVAIACWLVFLQGLGLAIPPFRSPF